MFFTLQELLPNRDNISSFLIKELNTTLHLSKIIRPAPEEFKNVKVMPAGTSCLSTPYSDNWIAVGDAAYAYDPISSYGITSALASGFYAGQALASTLSGKSDAMPTYRYIVENAFKAYMQRLMNHYALENRWSNSPFWKNRFQHFSQLN